MATSGSALARVHQGHTQDDPARWFKDGLIKWTERLGVNQTALPFDPNGPNRPERVQNRPKGAIRSVHARGGGEWRQVEADRPPPRPAGPPAGLFAPKLRVSVLHSGSRTVTPTFKPNRHPKPI